MKKNQVKFTSAVVQNDDIIDYVALTFKPACHIKRITKELYLKGRYNEHGEFVTDGEVFNVAVKEEHMRNRRSLRRIFKDLRQKIAHNYKGGIDELFVTLTYEKQTNDHVQVHNDFRAFWQRLKRAYPDKELGYISIVEPHASGMFHIHLLLREMRGEHLYIHFSDMDRIWGLGDVEVERLEHVDHMGAYFIAYFSNLELSPEEIEKYEAEGDIEERNGKKYIKGKRLDFYPDGMQIARSSRNMTRPVRLENAAAEALITPDLRKVYEHTKEIETVDKLGRTRKAEVRTAQYRREDQ